MANAMQPNSSVANITPVVLTPTAKTLATKAVAETVAKAAERQPDTVVEAPKPAAETKVEDQASARIAAFAKRERQLQKLAQDLKAEKEALTQEKARYTTDYIPKSKLKENALQALLDEGVSYEDLTQQILSQPQGPENQAIRKLQAQVDELKTKQTQALTQIDEQQKRAYDQAVNQIRNDVKILTDTDPQFEMIKQTGSTEAVVELIRETFNQKGLLMSADEAAKEIEDYLTEETFKLAQSSKIKAKLAPVVQTPAVENQNIQQIQTRTLTHANSGSAKPLTPRERAVMAFRGELK